RRDPLPPHSFPTRRSSDLSGMEDGLSIRRQTDELTGLSSIEVLDPAERPSAGKDLRPAVTLVDAKGKELFLANTNVPAHYMLPSDRKSTRLNSSHVKISYA